MWAGRIFLLPRARREQKVEQVDLLTEKLKKAKVAVLTDYRGLKVSQIQEFDSELKGPIAIAFGYDDLSLPPRLINEFVRTTRLKVEIVGGLVEGRVFDRDQIKQLADLPSREVLLAQLLGTLQSPVGQLVGIMQTPLQQLRGVLEAYKSKLEAA
jgi:large subunit ribosomal protein L10